jgi:hypothetical protein
MRSSNLGCCVGSAAAGAGLDARSEFIREILGLPKQELLGVFQRMRSRALSYPTVQPKIAVV